MEPAAAAEADARAEELHDVRARARHTRTRMTPIPSLSVAHMRRRPPRLTCAAPLPPCRARTQCARYGELADVSALLAAGVPADVADGEGRTALFLAAANGHAAVVQLLLAHGAVRRAAPLARPRTQHTRLARLQLCVRALRCRSCAAAADASQQPYGRRRACIRAFVRCCAAGREARQG
jgi:ankyrin repeat protein